MDGMKGRGGTQPKRMMSERDTEIERGRKLSNIELMNEKMMNELRGTGQLHQ